jgi:hypothetical protein
MTKLTLIFLVLSVFTACNYNQLSSGVTNATPPPVKTDPRNVTGFTRVHVANNLAAEITVGGDFAVTIEGDEKLVDIITTTVEEDVLVIALSKKETRETRVAVKISMPELKALEVSGASTAVVTGVKGDDIRVQANGATKIKISGEVKALEAHAYGASMIDAEGLKAETVDVEAMGVASAGVSASKKLKAKAAGMAKIVYTGDPKVEKETKDTSTVSKKE